MSLGVCYYPEHWPDSWWARDASRMRAMGIEYVRIGEFAWSRLEPRRGDFRWDWMDRAVDTLGEAGLKIVLGTPTATPPKWLVDEHPDILPYDIDGRVRGFGSRRHTTFSSKTWWDESRRIVEAVAGRYGEHPALVGWQTDNEYGCHDTVLSWGPEDLKAFRAWLRTRYQSADQLNEAWGNVFWSMEVNGFDEVSLPNLTVTEAAPAARLDFRRFHSEQVGSYDRMQREIIRKHSPGRFVTHNFMGFFTEFDHWQVADGLDFASWDSYPIGFVERFPFSDEERGRWAETSHPDIAPFHHDLYRGVGRGRFWVMEQQPGPVNWAPWNPVPKPGMIRLFTWEALAHGADVVSYFRWRQAPFAQEQFHAGLNMTGLDELSQGGLEAQAVGRELAALGDLPSTGEARVALVFDYEAAWVTEIQPQGQDFRYVELAFRWYEAARRLGLDIDILAPGMSLEGYALVLVPSLPIVGEAAERAFAAADGVVLFGPRTGSRDRNFCIPPGLAPGPLRDTLGFRVRESASLRPNLSYAVTGKVEGRGVRWRDHWETELSPLARFADGGAALVASGNRLSLACWPDAELLDSVMRLAAGRAGLEITEVPEAVRLRRRGNLTFAFNYGDAVWKGPKGADYVLGGRKVGPQDVAAWQG